MAADIREVFVIRIHHNMALSLSTQNVNITAFDFDQGSVVLAPQNIRSGLKSLPRLVHNRSLFDQIRDVFVLSKAIDTARPDIVHVNALQDLLSAFFAVRIGALKGLRPAIIAMSRNSLSWENPKKAWLYANFIKLFADGFIALATTHQNRLIRLGVPAEKLTAIPNPFDPSFVEDANSGEGRQSGGALRIIYVANICENKAQDVLITAAASVLKKHPEVQFELVGKVLAGQEEYAAKLNLLMRQFDIERNIHLTGEVPYDDVLARLHASDIFVFPTLAEMMPRAVIEAMVIGKPVIASAVDGILDLIQDGKTGLLVEAGNSAQLADSICELVENPDLAQALGAAGRQYVLEYCSPAEVGRQFCDFYQQIRSRI